MIELSVSYVHIGAMESVPLLCAYCSISSSSQFMPLYFVHVVFSLWSLVPTLVWLYNSFLKTKLQCHLFWKGAAFAYGELVTFVFLILLGFL